MKGDTQTPQPEPEPEYVAFAVLVKKDLLITYDRDQIQRSLDSAIDRLAVVRCGESQQMCVR